MAGEHGTPRSFRSGCRCSECHAAIADYHRRKRDRQRERARARRESRRMNAVADVGLPAAPAFDTSWMAAAACRDVDTSVFFAKQPKDRLVEAAKRICEGCEVSRQCLNFAIATCAVGVWGGTTAEERRKLRPDSISCADCGEPMAWKSVKHVRCAECYPAYRLQQKYGWDHEVGKFRQEASA